MPLQLSFCRVAALIILHMVGRVCLRRSTITRADCCIDCDVCLPIYSDYEYSHCVGPSTILSRYVFSSPSSLSFPPKQPCFYFIFAARASRRDIPSVCCKCPRELAIILLRPPTRAIRSPSTARGHVLPAPPFLVGRRAGLQTVACRCDSYAILVALCHRIKSTDGTARTAKRETGAS